MPEPDLFAVIFNAQDEFTPAVLAWVRRQHAPDLLDSGFLSAHCFEPITGERRFINIYEQERDVLRSAAYVSAREKDAAGLTKNESKLVYVQKATYRQTALGRNGAPRSFGAGGDWLGVLRFDLRDDLDAELEEWLGQRLPELMRHGASRVRLAFRNGFHPLWPKDLAPRAVILIESAEEPAYIGSLEKDLHDRFGNDVENVGLTTGKRWYYSRRLS